MGDLSTRLDDSLLGLVHNRVGSVFIVEPDDCRLLLINGKRTGNDGESGSEDSEGLHIGVIEEIV